MEQKTQTHEQILEAKRSNVRVLVTYFAELWLKVVRGAERGSSSGYRVRV